MIGLNDEPPKKEALHLENGPVLLDQKLSTLGVADLAAELDSLDKEMEARIRKKFDWRIVPVSTLIYLMAFIDRYALTKMNVEGLMLMYTVQE